MVEIKDFSGYYVDENGNVFSAKTNKYLSPCKDKYGYLFVMLYKDKKQFCQKIHRLVAKAFIPNPNGYLQVNHKNENKTDNRVENLEWCTAKYNINYGTAMKRAADTRKEKGYYWIEQSIETRKLHNPNNENYYKIAESRRLNGTNRMYSLMKPVEQLTEDGEVIAEYPSITDAAIAVGTSRKNISHCLLGKQETAKKYKWRYKLC